MSTSLLGTLFRTVVIAGSIAASVYAVMVPLTARAADIVEQTHTIRISP